MKKIQMILSGQRPLIDSWHYLIGNYRYWAFYKHPNLLRPHIREQIKWRINYWMKEECYGLGYCTECGCETTALQMASKSCDKPCYPILLNPSEWDKFKRGGCLIDKSGYWQLQDLPSKKLTFASHKRLKQKYDVQTSH